MLPNTHPGELISDSGKTDSAQLVEKQPED